MTGYSDIGYQSSDARLRLYARDYGIPAEAGAQAILCLHGLTRNSADFHDLALHLNDRYRVISVDQRGRGLSHWDPEPVHYQPAIYVQDMLALMDYLALKRVIVIGTSMGGLMAMIMGAAYRDRLIGAVINDIGPEVDPVGLARIAGYAGKTRPAASWAEAAELARLVNATAFPDYGPDDWMAFARRTYADGPDGVPVLAYDPQIARGLQANTDAPVVPPDLWPLWDSLEGLPMLAIRGGLSDLLSAETFRQMQARHAGLRTLTLANRGHAPMLNEPEAITAIDAFLADLKVSA